VSGIDEQDRHDKKTLMVYVPPPLLYFSGVKPGDIIFQDEEDLMQYYERIKMNSGETNDGQE